MESGGERAHGQLDLEERSEAACSQTAGLHATPGAITDPGAITASPWKTPVNMTSRCFKLGLLNDR